MTSEHVLTICGEALSIAQVHEVAVGRLGVVASHDTSVRRRMQESVDLVERAVSEQWRVYGVTTGFGSMSDMAVPSELAAASQNNLLAFLATAAGNPLEARHVRTAMLLRANVLMRGLSGIRFEFVDRLCRFLEAGVTPVVRDLGSIGASGDLVPLATIARAITGNVKSTLVQVGERTVEAEVALRELDLAPLELRPKEGLAIVNGTSFSSAIAANCVHETRRLTVTALVCQAMMLRALCVQDDPFHPFVHHCKPHPGQLWTARMMREFLTNDHDHSPPAAASDHVQDRYSLRCLPQYMGPIVEAIARIAHTVQIEMNSVSDNPLVDARHDRFHQGGNFLGQYVGIAMDDLRRCLGLMAKHLDVQIAQLVSPEFNRGLSPSLRGNDSLAYNMGLKGLQITGNSIAPLLTYYGNPIVEHFPTHAEQFNQNVNGLSWGAANLAWKSVELFQTYAAIALIFAVQALDLRAKIELGCYDGRLLLGAQLQQVYSAVCEALHVDPDRDCPLVYDDQDQSLEQYIQRLRDDLAGEGGILRAIEPVLQSFDEEKLAC